LSDEDHQEESDRLILNSERKPINRYRPVARKRDFAKEKAVPTFLDWAQRAKGSGSSREGGKGVGVRNEREKK